MRTLYTLATTLLGVGLLAGCPGTIQVTGGTDLGPIVDALKIITTGAGTADTETILVSSRGGTCARQQGAAEDINALADDYNDLVPDDYEDVDAMRAYCEELIEYYEQVAAVYSRIYEVNHWMGNFYVWSDTGYSLDAGEYDSASGFAGTITKIEGNPYAGYRTIDFDCQEYAEAYVNGDSLATIPTGPTLDEYYESTDQWGISEGALTIEQRGDRLHVSIEEGELSDANGRDAGAFTMTARLTDCEYEVAPYAVAR